MRIRRRVSVSWLVLAAPGIAVACGSNGASSTTADAGSDSSLLDAPPEETSIPDAGGDTTAGPEAGGVEGGSESGSPTLPEASPDGGPDAARPDASADASVDAAADASGDAGDGCVSGTACTPINACDLGSYDCSTSSCTDTGQALGNGTSCGGGWTCASGQCVAPANPQSCATTGAGVTDCGSSHESCCTSLAVPGGTFYRTYTNAGDGGTGEMDPATVSGLRVDKYLVTVGRFRRFVAALGQGWLPPAGSGKHTHLNGGDGLANSAFPGTYEPGWSTSDDTSLEPTDTNLACFNEATWTATPGTHETLPITCASWFEAYAFCIWDGGFLPSEAEWGYVAAAGAQQREYPWGSAAPGTSSQYAIYNCDYPSGTGVCQGSTNIAPVGTPVAGAGLWGQLDLDGEMRQLLRDTENPYQDPCTDCAFIAMPSTSRVTRGAGFEDTAANLPSWVRYSTQAATRGDYLGFRCARTP